MVQIRVENLSCFALSYVLNPEWQERKRLDFKLFSAFVSHTLFLPCLLREKVKERISVLCWVTWTFSLDLEICFPIEFKSNLTVSTVWNTGETEDIYNKIWWFWHISIRPFKAHFNSSWLSLENEVLKFILPESL